MPSSWNEIRHNAVAFAREWGELYSEHAEAQTFWNEFFQAVALLGELHDALEAGGYSGHDLEQFLVRVLFCLFAEDT